MNSIRNRSIAALGAIVATFATVSASAPAHAETVAVRYGDLDLATTAGATALHRRIRAAADAVCGPEDRLFRARIAECRRAAIARAEASIASIGPRTLLAQR